MDGIFSFIRFLELLHDCGLLFCVSLVKFEGKDFQLKVLGKKGGGGGGGVPNGVVHVLMHDGLCVGNRTLKLFLFECHGFAVTYALLTSGQC